MNPGIYMVRNKINGDFYIGSTINLKTRESNHRYRNKTHKGNSIVRNAVLKYGEDNFEFIVLDYYIFGDFATREYINEILVSREQYYVDNLKPKYNIRIIDVSRSLGVCSDKQREHLKRIANIPRDPKTYIARALNYIGKHKGENNKNSIPINVYRTSNLEFVETVVGLRNCSEKYGVDNKIIRDLNKKGYTNLYKREFVFCYPSNNIKDLYRTRKNKKL